MKDTIGLDDRLMTSICVLLNKKTAVAKNWRHLATAFDVRDQVKKKCEPGQPKRPTETLFDWIFSEKRSLTVGGLINALDKIERRDLVEIVKQCYFQQQSRR